MTYAGSELVFSFVKLADGCGLIGMRAAGVLRDLVYWMTPGGKFMVCGSSVIPQTVDCPVWDLVFQDLDLDNVDKIVCATISMFDEVMWFYPSKSGGTGENDSYVKYNALYQAWDYGKLPRSAWQDYSASGNPLGAAPDGALYRHETGYTAAGDALEWSFSTGAFMVSEGASMTFVDWVLPDFRYGFINDSSSDSAITMTIGGYRYANSGVFTTAPLTCDPTGRGALVTRLRARALQFTFSGSGFFRLGNVRIRANPDGRYL